MKSLVRALGSLLLLCVLLAAPVSAAEDAGDFRELLPPNPFTIGPQWTELSVKCQSGDNTLYGTLTCPKETGNRMPVAILLHGLNTDRHWCDDIAWYLADNGIASVRFDFSGNGQSGGAQEDMTISGEARDVSAILDYVEGLRFADPDNIFILGKSMGAVAATITAQDRGDEIRAMSLWYPGFGVAVNTRFGYFLGEFYPPWDPPELLEIAGYTYGRAFLEEAAGLDLPEIMAAYDGPVQIIHGDRDFIAPLFFSLGAERAFPNAELHVVPGGGHGFLMPQELHALEDLLQFIQANLA